MIARSPSAVACRNTPGGGRTAMPDSDRDRRTQQADRLRRVVALDLGNPRQAMSRGEIGQRGAVLQRQRRVRRSSMSGPESSRLMTTEASRRTARRPCSKRAQRRHQRHQRRMQHQAVGDVDDVGGTLLVQAQDDAAGRAADREVDAAALPGQAGDERQRIGRRKAGLAQRMGQQAGFPGAVVGVAPVLQHAAAAAAEMAAGRRRPGPRWRSLMVPATACQPSPRGLQRMGADGLAGQGERQIQRRAVRQVGDAVALGPDALDPDRGRFGRFSPGWFSDLRNVICGSSMTGPSDDPDVTAWTLLNGRALLYPLRYRHESP